MNEVLDYRVNPGMQALGRIGGLTSQATRAGTRKRDLGVGQGRKPALMRAIDEVTIHQRLDPYLSLKGLAGYCGLSRRTLQHLVNNPGDLPPSYRIGGKSRVRRSEFDARMTRRRNQKPLEPARLAAADARPQLNARPRK